METAVNYLLKRLAEEGRVDLVEEYHAQDRRYHRSLAITRKEKYLNGCKQSLESAIPGSAWHARLEGRIARGEVALAMMKEMQDDAAG